MTATPMPGYSDFAQTADNDVSSNFVDGRWESDAMNFGLGPMHMSFEPARMNFDNVTMDPEVMMAMHVDGGMGPSQNGPFVTGPEMSSSYGYRPVQAPLRTSSDPQIGSSAEIFYPSNGTYSGADAGAADLAAMFAAQDAWTVFQ